MGHDPADLERRLREAEGRLAEYRRALEMTRIWWDDDDRYRAPWSHGIEAHDACRWKPCPACVARSTIMGLLSGTTP